MNELEKVLDDWSTMRIIEALITQLQKSRCPSYNDDKVLYHLERALKASEKKEPPFN